MPRMFSLMLVFLFVLCSHLFSDEFESLHSFRDTATGKYGYINTAGAIVIRPSFCEAGAFRDGIARVYFGSGNCGGSAFITPQGKTVYSSPDFTKRFGRWGVAREFSDGLARVTTFAANGRQLWGYINSSGRFAIQPKYDTASDFHEGYAVASHIQGEKRKTVIIDKKGKEYDVLPDTLESPQINPDDFTGKFSDGLLAVKFANSQWGFIDIKGKVVLRPRYNSALSDNDGSEFFPFFHNGRAFVEMADESGDIKTYIINRQGTVVKELNTSRIINFSEGIAFMDTGSHLSSAAIDIDGNMLFQTGGGKQFGSFSEGLCWFKSEIGGKGGYVDKSGKVIIELSRCTSLSSFINGLAVVERNNGEFIYIDRSGKVVLE